MSLYEARKEIGDAVRARLSERGLSYQDVSDSVNGLSTSEISRITCAEDYSLKSLATLLSALDLKIEFKEKVQ
ncbi:hypothetical protein ACFX4N_24660 [Priestia sp. YIM B13551]|uniref:hypothetical protein n=1 Tax=Priestia sp. YIM B13551 TaxID=3366306 RepID=UPI003672F2D4